MQPGALKHPRAVIASPPPAADLVALGHEIARLRHAAGWSIDRLADATGLARRTIINVEAGTQVPKIDTLHAIAHALDIPLPELVAVVCTGHSGSRSS